jgi:hypothetical protein
VISARAGLAGGNFFLTTKYREKDSHISLTAPGIEATVRTNNTLEAKMAARKRTPWSKWDMVRAIAVLLFIGALLLLAGCPSNPADEILSGTLSFSPGFAVGASGNACYVFLDADTDITNGYIKRLIIPDTTAVTSLSYEIDTADVPAGTYFLLGVYDFEDTAGTNMDDGNPLVWEALKWWGGSGANPPGAANVTDLSGTYNLVLVDLG